MINLNSNLNGRLSYKIYNKNGELKQTKSNITNFITPTGLSLISQFSIADCFRFVSVGSGTSANTILGMGTTGLSIPIQQFSYIGSRTNYSDPTTSNYENPSCGFTEQLGSVTLSRGWKIPSGSGVFDGNYNISEIMFSPGEPFNQYNQCGATAGGNDQSIIADYYDSIGTPICAATYAFSRIITPIEVQQNDFLVISYDLTISYNTGIQSFSYPISNTFSTNWSGVLTGSMSQIHHGLKLINDGSVTDLSQYHNQINPYGEQYSWITEYGESFIPLFGSPMEPSVSNNNIISYLSTDNVQFLVNQFSGGALITGQWQPYNPNGFPPSSGLMSSIPQPTNTNFPQYFNIRNPLNNNQIFPQQSNILNSVTQGAGVLSDLNYILNSNCTKRNQMLPFISSGRARSIVYPFTFNGINAANVELINPYGSQTTWDGSVTSQPSVRSMVLNYVDNAAGDLISQGNNTTQNDTFYPFIDILFTGTQGESLVPTGSDFTFSTPTNDYFFLEGGGNLTFAFLLTWSSPCPPGTIGC